MNLTKPSIFFLKKELTCTDLTASITPTLGPTGCVFMPTPGAWGDMLLAPPGLGTELLICMLPGGWPGPNRICWFIRALRRRLKWARWSSCCCRWIRIYKNKPAKKWNTGILQKKVENYSKPFYPKYCHNEELQYGPATSGTVKISRNPLKFFHEITYISTWYG